METKNKKIIKHCDKQIIHVNGVYHHFYDCDLPENYKKQSEETVYNMYIKNLKSKAKKRNIEFKLTVDDLKKKLKEQQYTCPFTKFTMYLDSMDDKICSVDRIDSNGVYEYNNIQWVHKIINLMKRNLSDEDFMDLCYLITKPLSDKREINIELSKTHNWGGCGNLSSKYFNSLRRGAIKRNIDFDIDIKYAWEIFEKQGGICALTGLPIHFVRNYKNSFGKQTASLDRIDNDFGYVKQNIQWVNKKMNFVKNKLRESIIYLFSYIIISQNNYKPDVNKIILRETMKL